MDRRATRLIAATTPLLVLTLACGSDGGAGGGGADGVVLTSRVSVAGRGGRDCTDREARARLTHGGPPSIQLLEPEDIPAGALQITDCADLVADYAPLARCETAEELHLDDPRVTEAIVARTRYIFAGALVERAQSDCQAAGGRWSASTAREAPRSWLARRSRELHRAWEALR